MVDLELIFGMSYFGIQGSFGIKLDYVTTRGIGDV